MKNYIPIFLVFLFSSVLAATMERPQGVVYLFPLDQSELVSLSSEIIVRPQRPVDRSSLSADLFAVVGEKSGEHTGRVVVAADKKTILFKPDDFFQPNEHVHVTLRQGLQTADGVLVPGFEFGFKTTPLAKPLSILDYKDELNLLRLPAGLTTVGLQKTGVTDSLPSDFPTFHVAVNGEPAPGDVFFSPTRFISNNGYNLRVGNDGTLKYYKKVTNGVPFDFKALPNGMLSYGVMSSFYEFGGGGDTEFFMMDSSYSIVDQIQMGNGYIADFHEFLYLPNGHIFMVTYDLQPVNMNEIVPGGHPGALVAGSVVQELDQDRNVIFQWRSWDHYELTDSYADLTQSIFDAIHINAIEFDQTDDNLIISTLALAEATKINRQNGDIIWRMGGKNNEFTFINESQEHAPLYFMFQHDIRRLSNGNITIFDGGDTQRRQYSRVVEYAINEESKTATKVWEFRKDPDIFSPNMGSAQRLPNGNTLIGWGLASMYGLPAVTEVDPQGNVVFELTFDKPLTASYRAMKFEWDGGKPAADVTWSEVLVGNTYDFDQDDQHTGVSLKFTEKEGFGYNEAVVKRYNYSPLMPQFLGKAPIVDPSRIVVSQFNIYNIKANIMFDVDFFGIDAPDSILVYHREFEGNGLFLPLPTTYNPATNKIVAKMTKFGEFILATPDKQTQPFPPLPVKPSDGQMVDQTKPVRLEWTPVGYITEYTLQVARDVDFTDIAAEEQYITSAIYDLNVQPNLNYYWRVKAYNDAGESEWSPVVTFSAKAPYIKLKTPVAGAKWRRGLEYYVTWDDIISEDVALELYQNNSFIMAIDTAASTGGYKWDIPLFVDIANDYKIKISSIDNPKVFDMSQSTFAITDTATAVNDARQSPREFQLLQNYPNPFNSTTRISYKVPEIGHVVLAVYDLRGVRLATLVDELQAANHYTVEFDAGDLATGIYFYKLDIGSKYSTVKKMALVR